MSNFRSIMACAGLFAACSISPGATTDPMGGIVITCKANSDTAIGIPFTRAPIFEGRVASVSGSQITVAGDPGWSVDELIYEDGVQDNHYYILISSGSKEGAFYTITAHSNNSVTVDLDPFGLGVDDDLSDVATGGATGDIVKIIPHWTPGVLVGQDGPNGLEILLYGNSTAGINLSSSNSFEHFNGFGWYDGGTPVDDAIIFPYEAFILRNNTGSDYALGISGTVPMTKHRSVIRTLQTGKMQDNRIFFNSPVEAMIGDVGLGIVDGVELLIFESENPVKNMSASNTIQYFEGFGWYDGGTRVDDPSDPDNQFYLQPGHSYILRKPAAPAENLSWQALPGYLE